MYKKLLSVSLLSVFLFTFAFATVFAQIEGPKEGCTITQDMEVGKWKTWKSAGIFKLARDNSGNGEWEAAERISDTVFPATIDTVVVRDANMIIIPQSAKVNGIGSFADIKRENTLPPNWAVFCLLGTIDTITDWIFTFLIVASVALIAIAGFMWMTAGAAPERQKKAGGMLMAAVIGIVIALLAKVIPSVVTGILS